MGHRIEIVNWNPRVSASKDVVGFIARRRVNNFGDLLGPLVVQRLLAHLGVDESRGVKRARLLSIGSIMHFALNGDTIWGTGVNGKVDYKTHQFAQLDVRAVRGPRTAEFLRRRGVAVPDVYGDPALLIPILWPQLSTVTKKHDVSIVPNLNDRQNYVEWDCIDPTANLDIVLNRIAMSRLVVGSSLHGIIVAEALGIPARLVHSQAESRFKYDDYYEGSGRSSWRSASTIREAIEMGGETPVSTDIIQPLIDSFPVDLWGA